MVGPHVDDARRLGTGFFFLAQLAVDTTPVSARRTDGSARRIAAQQDGLAAEAARQRNVRTYPGLVGHRRRVHFVVLALEVEGTLVKRDASTDHPVVERPSSTQRNAVDGLIGATGVVSPVERVNGVCRGLWLLPCWSCWVLPALVVTHFRHRMWSGSGVSLVWLGEVGVLWHWCAVRCSCYVYRFCTILSTDCFAVVLCEKMAKPPSPYLSPSTSDFVPSSPSRWVHGGPLEGSLLRGGLGSGGRRGLGREGGSRGEVPKMRGGGGASLCGRGPVKGRPLDC